MAKKANKASELEPTNALLEAAREVIAEADLLLSSKKPPTDRFRAAVEKLEARFNG